MTIVTVSSGFLHSHGRMPYIRSEADRLCEEIAAQNHGVVSRTAARRAGLSDRQIADRQAMGILRPRLPGVCIHAAISPSVRTEQAAAQAWAGPEAFFSHRTGAQIWELDGAPDDHLEICAYEGLKAEGILVHRLGAGDRPVVQTRFGLRVACVERVLFDLGSVAGHQTVGRCMDDALRRRLTTVPRLTAYLDEHCGRGRRGTRTFRLLVENRDHRDEKAGSRMETRMLAILKAIKGARCVPQHLVQGRRRRYYLDFAYPELKLGIECQGLRWHFGEERFKQDLRRGRELTLLGWTMLYFTWDDIVLGPERVELEVREAIGRLNPRFFSHFPRTLREK